MPSIWDVAVETDQAAIKVADVLQGIEPMTVYALLVERAHQAFHHAVTLCIMRDDELLAYSAASNQPRQL